jgi:hypothetical protein
MQSARNAQGSIWVEDISNVWEIFDGARSYAKGAVVLHMLRGVLGTNMFFNVLYEYANNPDLSYSVATTEDFQGVAETVSGEDLDYFFSQWIYGENYPVYNYHWDYVENGNQYDVWIAIQQPINSEPEFFTMPIEIQINTSGGNVLTTLFNNQQQQYFWVTVDDQPLSIIIDPNNWILNDAFYVPVELTHFTAETKKDKILLNWRTATETNNSGFEIEKKINLSENIIWENIGFVQGNGTTSISNTYNFTDYSPLLGKNTYRLKQINYDGTYNYSNEISTIYNTILHYGLDQNKPNPFNPTTQITYEIPENGMVHLSVYDLLGNEVSNIVNEYKTAGRHTVQFDGGNLSSGIYVYKLNINSFVKSRKMMLLK